MGSTPWPPALSAACSNVASTAAPTGSLGEAEDGGSLDWITCRSSPNRHALRAWSCARGADLDRILLGGISARSSVASESGRRRAQPLSCCRGPEPRHGRLVAYRLVLDRDRMGCRRCDRLGLRGVPSPWTRAGFK